MPRAPKIRLVDGCGHRYRRRRGDDLRGLLLGGCGGVSLSRGRAVAVGSDHLRLEGVGESGGGGGGEGLLHRRGSKGLRGLHVGGERKFYGWGGSVLQLQGRGVFVSWGGCRRCSVLDGARSSTVPSWDGGFGSPGLKICGKVTPLLSQTSKSSHIANGGGRLRIFHFPGLCRRGRHLWRWPS